MHIGKIALKSSVEECIFVYDSTALWMLIQRKN